MVFIVRLSYELLLRVVANTEAYEPLLLFVVYTEPMNESRTIRAYRTFDYTLADTIAYTRSKISTCTSHTTSTPSERFGIVFQLRAIQTRLCIVSTHCCHPKRLLITYLEIVIL